MGILVPLYLAGLTALSLPLIFHLVRRTPRHRQEFSSLMFLSPTVPRMTRRSRLDQLLLLLLRLTALALIALAFARPFFREAALASFADLPGRSVVILIDVSASMRRGDLWGQAVAQAQLQLDGLNPQDDVALYAFSDRVEKLIDLQRGTQEPAEGALTLEEKPGLVQSQLKSLQPGFAASDLGSALATVAGELDSDSDARQSSREPQIVVISDFQKGGRVDALQSFEWPQRVAVILRPLEIKATTNAFAHLLTSENDDGADLRVRVVNAADSQGDQFSLRWVSSTIEPRPSEGGAAVKKPEDVPVYVPPGQSRVVRFPRPEGALDSDRILLKGDDYDFDNTHFVVPPRQEQAVIHAVGTDKPEDSRGLFYFLKTAVANDPLRQVEIRLLDAGKPLGLSTEPRPGLVVVAQAVSDEAQAELKAHVERGGTVLLVAGDAAVAALLPVFFEGVEVAAAPAAQPAADDKDLLLGQIDFKHPLFAPFAGSRYGDFTKIHFWKHQAVIVKSPSSTHVVARFDNGDPAFLERTLGQGRVLALTSGWRPTDSQLALSSKFVTLMGGILDLASGGTEAIVSVAVNDAVPLPESLADSPLLVHTPDRKLIQLAKNTKAFTATDRPGIYLVEAEETAGGGQIADNQFRFAVNLAASEGNTAPLEIEQLEQHGVKLGAGLTRVEQIERVRQQRDVELEGRQRIWLWLIAAAVGILIFETVWAGRAERIIASTKEAVA